METALLNEEIVNQEVELGGNKLSVTNKRVIYNNAFIGLNELKSIKVKMVDVKQTLKVNNTKITNIVGAMCAILFTSYVTVVKQTYDSGTAVFVIMTLGSLIISYGVGTIVSFLILSTFKGAADASAKTLKLISLKIVKTDNTYFLNINFDTKYSEELKAFENTINNIIYK